MHHDDDLLALHPEAGPANSSGSPERQHAAVLLLHGLTSTPQSLGPLIHAVEEAGWPMRAPLLPGHGTSWQDLNRTTYENWYAAAQDALVELAHAQDDSGTPRNVIVVGLSLGGALAADLASRRADLVSGCALINPAFAATDWRLRFLPLMKHVMGSTPGIGDDIRRPGEPREVCYSRTPLRALHNFSQQWPDLLRRVEDLSLPVLLARSAYDRVVPALSSQRFLEHVGSNDVREVRLDQSGHVATLDYDAERLSQTLLDYIEEVSTR